MFFPVLIPGLALPVFRVYVLVLDLDSVVFNRIIEQYEMEFTINTLDDGNGVHEFVALSGEAKGKSVAGVASAGQNVIRDFLLELHILVF
jgi:hypothetical protein